MPIKTFVPLALLFYLLPLPAVFGDFNGINLTPNPLHVSADPNRAVKINWQVDWFEPTGGCCTTVKSDQLHLIVNGQIFATLAGGLSQSTTAGPAKIFHFSDYIRLNRSQIRQLLLTSPGSIHISRQFYEISLGTPQTVSLPLTITPNISGSRLSIDHIDLVFEDDSRTTLIPQHQKLRALAKINYRQNGLLQGEWRLVDSRSSQGLMRGRVIQTVNQPLSSVGSKQIILKSPPLPTHLLGLNLLFFAVKNKDINLETPLLRYFVTTAKPGTNIEPIKPLFPLNLTEISEQTLFKWQKITNAHAYHLIITDPQDSSFKTGKLVPPTETSLRLSPLTLRHMQANNRYQWHIKAYDPAGDLIGRSPKHPISLKK